MAIIASDSGSFTPVPPGNYIARCYRIIDLGTQETNGQYGLKLQHKVQIGWEILDTDESGKPLKSDDDMPLTISNRYTVSLSDKANLRSHLKSWRGRDFTPDELKAFDIANLLGAYCMLNVTHTQADNGKTYTNVASISPLPKQLRHNKPAPVHENELFDITAPNMELMGSFHEKLQDTIRASTEWRSRNASTNARPASNGASIDDLDSDIPF